MNEKLVKTISKYMPLKEVNKEDLNIGNIVVEVKDNFVNFMLVLGIQDDCLETTMKHMIFNLEYKQKEPLNKDLFLKTCMKGVVISFVPLFSIQVFDNIAFFAQESKNLLEKYLQTGISITSIGRIFPLYNTASRRLYKTTYFLSKDEVKALLLKGKFYNNSIPSTFLTFEEVKKYFEEQFEYCASLPSLKDSEEYKFYLKGKKMPKHYTGLAFRIELNLQYSFCAYYVKYSKFKHEYTLWRKMPSSSYQTSNSLKYKIFKEYYDNITSKPIAESCFDDKLKIKEGSDRLEEFFIIE